MTRRDEEVSLSDDGEAVVTFPIVDDAASIAVTLSGTVEILSRGGEEQALEASDHFELNQTDATYQVEDIFLRWDASDMQIMVVGKTGEERGGGEVEEGDKGKIV